MAFSRRKKIVFGFLTSLMLAIIMWLCDLGTLGRGSYTLLVHFHAPAPQPTQLVLMPVTRQELAKRICETTLKVGLNNVNFHDGDAIELKDNYGTRVQVGGRFDEQTAFSACGEESPAKAIGLWLLNGQPAGEVAVWRIYPRMSVKFKSICLDAA